MQDPNRNPGYPQGDPQDVEANKTIAALSYILFFLPLLAARDSRFAMYHANQGLLLLLVLVAGNFVLSLIPFIGWILLPLFNLAGFVYVILGVLNAAGGRVQPLPLMPNIEILK
ncbi:hypothetical protein QWJ34_17950 [Saccharibacillus sp. CPCC 101409]|uniref:DUF4870 domain-containing protein n=1 Tax=Saccharibacillus sp. CPCC 101409 TaxID=3058041 RepID=UPI0026715679|nr:hypothetical protein [Saccharibacillus sp. CPCC 101409]MDO3411651.1 hypothetical protein [Saccharibacillus sp. CPCC 101409]